MTLKALSLAEGTAYKKISASSRSVFQYRGCCLVTLVLHFNFEIAFFKKTHAAFGVLVDEMRLEAAYTTFRPFDYRVARRTHRYSRQNFAKYGPGNWTRKSNRQARCRNAFFADRGRYSTSYQQPLRSRFARDIGYINKYNPPNQYVRAPNSARCARSPICIKHRIRRFGVFNYARSRPPGRMPREKRAGET